MFICVFSFIFKNNIIIGIRVVFFFLFFSSNISGSFLLNHKSIMRILALIIRSVNWFVFVRVPWIHITYLCVVV